MAAWRWTRRLLAEVDAATAQIRDGARGTPAPVRRSPLDRRHRTGLANPAVRRLAALLAAG
ncbi:hypothetical protein [Micromonospora coerulea]